MRTALALTSAAVAAAILTAAPAQACECAGLWKDQMVCNALRDPGTGNVTVPSWLATRQGLLRDVPVYTQDTITNIITQGCRTIARRWTPVSMRQSRATSPRRTRRGSIGKPKLKRNSAASDGHRSVACNSKPPHSL